MPRNFHTEKKIFASIFGIFESLFATATANLVHINVSRSSTLNEHKQVCILKNHEFFPKKEENFVSGRSINLGSTCCVVVVRAND